jgi:hypothetical protein
LWQHQLPLAGGPEKILGGCGESRVVPERSTLRVVAFALIIFVVAHLALMGSG